MDQLSADALAAKRLGLSYGKYIALHRPEKPRAERYPKRNQRGQEKRPLCVVCGAQIPANSHRRKYCSPACSDKALQDQNKDQKKQRRKARMMSAESKN